MKNRGIFLTAFLILLVLSPVVSAYQWGFYNSEYAFSWIENNVGPYFAWFLGGYGDYLFERILLFFILIAFIFTILSKMPLFKNNIAANIIVTAAISLIASRFFGDADYIRTILAPYTVLGIALTAVIPLVIYFFFVQSFNQSSTLRRVLWIFFIVVFFAIWQSRSDELGQAAYIYLLTGIVAFVFLLADGTIRRIMWKDKMKAMDARNAEEAARKIRNQLDELQRDSARHTISDDFYNSERRRLQKQLKSLTKW